MRIFLRRFLLHRAKTRYLQQLVQRLIPEKVNMKKKNPGEFALQKVVTDDDDHSQ
jgi:hypothetical protein